MKANLLHIFIPLIFQLLIIDGYSQEDSYIQPSTTISELGKYGKMPISYYTGLPNINILLYNIKCGSLELPISLSYLASGIKVDQIASWVGLGWSLNAGGIVQSNKLGNSDLTKNVPLNILSVDPKTGVIIGNIPPEGCNYLGETEPDIYTFNFCGFQGQFIIDKNLIIHFLKSDQKLKVSSTTIPWNNILNIRESTTFSFIDNFGVIYKFEQHEYTTQKSKMCYAYDMPYDDANGNNGAGLINDICPQDIYESGGYGQTAWFLTEMISANGIDKITFEYDDEIEETTTSLSGTLSFWQEDGLNGIWLDEKWYGDAEMIWKPCGPEVNYLPHGSGTGSFSKITIKNETKKLKKITTSNGIIVEFSRVYLREDVEASSTNQNKRLDEVSIFASGNFKKKWTFNYTYFESSLDNSFSHYLNKRLRLSSIQTYDSPVGNSTTPPYYFSYYGDEVGENKMPFRTCYTGKDYLGYCNSSVNLYDARNVKKIFPNLSMSCIPQAIESDIWTAYTQFPTTPIFKMETYVTNYNENLMPVSFNSGSDRSANLNYAKAYTLKRIDFPTGGSTLFDFELHDFGSNAYGFANDCHSQGYNPCGGLRIKKITDIPIIGESEERVFTYDLNGVILDYPYFAYNQRAIVNCPSWGYRDLNLVKLQNQPLNDLYALSGEHIGYKSVTEEIIGKGKTVYNYYSGADLPNIFDTYYVGGYEDEISFAVPISQFFYPFFHGLSYKDYARGLIKNVEYFNEAGDTIKKKSFTYDFIDGSKVFGNQLQRLEGANFRLNIYYYNTGYTQLKDECEIEYNDANTPTIVKSNSFIYNTLNLLSKGSEVQSNGYTSDYAYKYPLDYPSDCEETYHCSENHDECYSQANLTYSTNIQMCENYGIYSQEYAACMAQAESDLSNAYNLCDIDYTECSSNCNPEQSSSIEAINVLKQKNMIASIIEKNKKVNGKIVEGEVTEYKVSYSNQVHPFKTYTFTSQNPVEIDKLSHSSADLSSIVIDYCDSTITYDKWDIQGNLIQKHIVNGIYTNYIWGYNNTKLIAETKNATTTECDYNGFEDSGYTGWYASSSMPITSSDLIKTGRTSFFLYDETGLSKSFDVGKNAQNHSGYKASVWVKKGIDIGFIEIGIVGQTPTRKYNTGEVNEWHLLEVELPQVKLEGYINDNLKIKVKIGSTSGNGAYFDDLRFYPMDAQMTTYTYDPLIGVTSVSDVNNKPTIYEYDGFGRLVLTRDYLGDILKKYEYHYKTP